MLPAPVISSETNMLHTHTRNSNPSHVTVRFDDGAESFPLAAGATLTELVDYIGVLRAQHDGAPISIDIAFITERAQSPARANTRAPRAH